MRLDQRLCVRDAGVEGSNPFTPTTFQRIRYWQLAYFWRTLIYQSTSQMLRIFIHMRVNLRQHRAVRMPHKSRDGQMVMTLDKLPCTEAVPGSITKHTLSHSLGNTVESIADGVLCPWSAAIVFEQLSTTGFFEQQAFCNLPSPAMQVDDPLGSLALRFLRREYDALMHHINVARFNVANLLRAAAGVPDKFQQIAEWVAWTQPRKNLRKVARLHVNLTAFSLWLFKPGNGVNVGISQLDSPVIDSLNGDDSAAFVGIAPGRVGVYPFRDVEGLEIGGRNARIITKKLEEILDMALIPLNAAWRSVLLAPGKILAGEIVECNTVIHA